MNKAFLISLIQEAANRTIKNDKFSMDMSGHSLVLITAAGTISIASALLGWLTTQIPGIIP